MPQRSLWFHLYGQIIQKQNKTWLCINHTYLVYCIPPPIAPNTNTYSRHSTGKTMLIIPTMSHGIIYSLLGQKIPIMHWKYTIEVSGAKANKVSASVRNINNWLETFFFFEFIIIANTIFSKRDIWYLSRGPFQYARRHLIVRLREISKLLASYLSLKLCDRSDIWQAPGQFCRRACQISKRCDNLNYQSRGFETSQDLTIRRLICYWNGLRFMVRFHSPNVAKCCV